VDFPGSADVVGNCPALSVAADQNLDSETGSGSTREEQTPQTKIIYLEYRHFYLVM
jgi:hypothetical protein